MKWNTCMCLLYISYEKAMMGMIGMVAPYPKKFHSFLWEYDLIYVSLTYTHLWGTKLGLNPLAPEFSFKF
jgi:hypothetical protein